MKFRSLDEFDRAFMADFGAKDSAAFSANPYDPFMQAVSSSAGKSKKARKLPFARAQILHIVISCVLLACMLLLLLAFVLLPLFGVKLVKVQSPSMAQYYTENSIAWVVPAKYENIHIGDILVYERANDQIVTNKVAALSPRQQTITVQTSRGVTDTIDYSQVQGVVRFTIPYLGRFLELFVNANIALKLMTALLVLLLFVFLWGLSYYSSRPKTET